MREPRAAGRPRLPEDLAEALHSQGIRDRRVIAAFRAIPRARFVPPTAAHLAYMDEPIRIPTGKVTTQPSQGSMGQILQLGLACPRNSS